MIYTVKCTNIYDSKEIFRHLKAVNSFELHFNYTFFFVIYIFMLSNFFVQKITLWNWKYVFFLFCCCNWNSETSINLYSSCVGVNHNSACLFKMGNFSSENYSDDQMPRSLKAFYNNSFWRIFKIRKICWKNCHHFGCWNLLSNRRQPFFSNWFFSCSRCCIDTRCGCFGCHSS